MFFPPNRGLSKIGKGFQLTDPQQEVIFTPQKSAGLLWSHIGFSYPNEFKIDKISEERDDQKETKIIVLLLQKLKAEISRSPMAAEVLMEKLNDKGKVLQTLEEQLYQLTGIHAETHVSRSFA